MAVAVVMDFEGGTLEQYDEVVDRMGFARSGPGAPGGLFHWVTRTDKGIRVTDVWETREQFEHFSTDQIRPITRDVGVPQEPAVSIHEVHNYLTAG
jgi:hypothetical protein